MFRPDLIDDRVEDLDDAFKGTDVQTGANHFNMLLIGH
jgi:hypothetical protein